MINNFSGKYLFLSNFYPCEVYFGDIVFPSVEHAFQAAKTTDVNERLKIAKCGDPANAKRLGRQVKLRRGWDEIKDTVMYMLLKRKFKGELKMMLLATGDEELIEGNWWGDKYWGVCRGVGENKLGKLLMKLREELRKCCLK